MLDFAGLVSVRPRMEEPTVRFTCDVPVGTYNKLRDRLDRHNAPIRAGAGGSLLKLTTLTRSLWGSYLGGKL